MTSDARDSSACMPTSACLTPLGREMVKTRQSERRTRIALAGGVLGGFFFPVIVGAIVGQRYAVRLGWSDNRVHELMGSTARLLPYLVAAIVFAVIGTTVSSTETLARWSMRRSQIRASTNDRRSHDLATVVFEVVATAIPFVYLTILVVVALVDTGEAFAFGLGVPSGVLVACGLAARRGDLYSCARCEYPWHDGEALRCSECQRMRVPPDGLRIGERRRSIPLIAAGVLVFLVGIVLDMPDLFW